jgi:hypothetical protein
MSSTARRVDVRGGIRIPFARQAQQERGRDLPNRLKANSRPHNQPSSAPSSERGR